MEQTKVIDLFAGPGGLGEGFSRFAEGRGFHISVSAEMNAAAHETLSLRSFVHHAFNDDDKQAVSAYKRFCIEGKSEHPSVTCPKLWKKVTSEVLMTELGTIQGNDLLDSTIKKLKIIGKTSVVIGGPPCQAFSLVGRARNKGNPEYIPEADNRHFLYRQYLRIIDSVEPAVFVMENVKGILSSQIEGDFIFRRILSDLSCPGSALKTGKKTKYSIFSVVTGTRYDHGDDTDSIDPSDFIVRAENYGIPQSRHRVILLGVRDDLRYDGRYSLVLQPGVTLEDAIGDMPRLRSKVSRQDSPEAWLASIDRGLRSVIADAKRKKNNDLADALNLAYGKLESSLPTNATGAKRHGESILRKKVLDRWYNGKTVIDVWLNHETRGHMPSDLVRYFYAAVYARHYGYPPNGVNGFDLKGLAPDHQSWGSGKFNDRFRVQMLDRPSTTITSHISKDGHYFIHPDPLQCRSLTVREAARLQTFPDDYYFQGNRTEQYNQVGNAVPPLLAYKIAELVAKILER